MKRAKLLTGAIAAVTILAFSSCKKDNGSGGGAGVSATVGGTGWQANYSASVYSGGFVDVEGFSIKNGDTTNISLSILDNVEIGKPDQDDATQFYYIKGQTIYTSSQYTGSAHGIVTVTSWDKTAKKIAGTFSGVLYNTNNVKDSIAIAGGSFNTPYQEQ